MISEQKMFFIGNDIIDMKDKDTPYKVNDKRFCKRAFTSNEYDMIQKAEEPHNLLWQLWSMKESTYKAVKQCFIDTTFQPKNFIASNCLKGIYYKDIYMKTFVRSNSDYIHSTAILPFQYEDNYKNNDMHNLRYRNWIDDKNMLAQKMKYINRNINESTLVRFQLKNNLSKLFNLHIDSISIKKYKKIPYVYFKDKRLLFSISLSHQGRFVASCIDEGGLV